MGIFHKTCFGLDISDVSIEALELKKSFGKIKISSYGRVKLDQGVIENGEIFKKDELIEAIKKVLASSQPKPIKNKNVILSLPESRIFTHVFRFPRNLNEKQIEQLIQYQAEEIIPLPFDQTSHDFKVITVGDDYQEIFYAAAAKVIIEEYREVLEGAELVPAAFDLESWALARSLVDSNPFEGALIVDMGARTTILIIYDHNGVRVSANIPIAGNKFTQAVAKKLKIPQEIAEDLKRANGLDQSKEKGRVSKILEPKINEIIKEIRITIDYYQKNTKYNITRIILCGGSSLLPKIKDYFYSQLKISTEIGDPLSLIEENKIISPDKAVLYSTVVGLALRGIDKKLLDSDINLLTKEKMEKFISPIKSDMEIKKPPEKKIKIQKEKQPSIQRTKRNTRQIILIVIFILLIVVFGLVFWWKNSQIPEVKKYTPTASSTESPVKVDLNFPIKVLLAAKETLAADEINGRILETTQEKTSTYNTSSGEAVKKVKAAAIGQATIINDYSANQPLVATTRLLTKDGILYRIKKDVVVPAKGSVKVDIYADKEGKEYEIGPSDFTIPGLSASMQKYIYAKSETPTTGGEKDIRVLTQDDLDKAKDQLTSEIEKEAADSLAKDLKENEILISQSITKEIIEEKATKKVNEETDQFSLTLKIKMQFLAYDKNELTEKANSGLEKKVTNKEEIKNYQLSQVEFTNINYNQNDNLVSIDVSLTAQKSLTEQ